MNTNTVTDLINASNLNVDSKQEGIDELCSHTFTTINQSQGRMYDKSEFEFKIKQIDTDSKPHMIEIQWFQIGGDVINSRTENSKGEYNKYIEEGPHPITDDIIFVMKNASVK